MLLALFGAMAGQAVVGYVSLVYMNLFLTQTLKVDASTAESARRRRAGAATPFYMLSGRIADRIGRKPQVVDRLPDRGADALPDLPRPDALRESAIEAAQTQSSGRRRRRPAECSFQFDPVGGARFTSSCDVAKTALAGMRIPYSNEAAPPGTLARVRVGEASVALVRWRSARERRVQGAHRGVS